ncbi:hypothetical protein [uncultured Dokdonia sp.]|uniref:hypothetical protein n=1 Tax=uncultured Dokdonia sp. TaxID=575653 RepID=UPI002602B826|nr:hypothetical protein [uncultured Dokdonia sp.]
MKKILNLGKQLSTTEQKDIFGGGQSKNPCPCTTNYENHGNGECSYPAVQSGFPSGLRCLGSIQPNGTCCVG